MRNCSFVFCLVSSLLVNVALAETSTIETLQNLSQFSSTDADTVVVVRHGLITDNPALKEKAESATAEILSDSPFSAADFDHVVALVPQPNQQSAGFKAIASELVPQMPTESTESEAADQPQPLDGCAVYVKFKRPVTVEELKAAIESQSDALQHVTSSAANEEGATPESTYHVIRWRDKEFLYSKNPSLPAILKVEDQAFILCPFSQLREGFARQTTDAKWLEKYTDDDFAGDFVVATELDEALVAQAAQGSMEPLSKAQRLFFSLDFDATDLATVHIQFKNKDAAKDVVSMVRGLHAMGKGMVSQKAEEARSAAGNDKNTTWVSNHLETIYDSVNFELDKSTAVITVPRPKDFDELVMRVAKIGEDYRTKQVAEFESVAEQLDAAVEQQTDGDTPSETKDALEALGIE